MSAPPRGDPATDHSRLWNHILVPSPGLYAIDPIHSFVGFSAQHLVVGRVRGRFEGIAGTVRIGEDPRTSSVEATIETASINTSFPARDDDLRSARFLDVSTHPRMTYRSSGVTERPRADWLMEGELTLRGVTRSVPLTVRFEGSITDSSGNPRSSFHAIGSLTRSQFGVDAELIQEAGSMLIGDDILLDLEVEATQQS